MLKKYTRKLASRMSAASLAVAALAGITGGLIARERGTDTLVTQTMEEAQRLLRHDAYRPVGAQAARNAQAAVLALTATHFDIAQIYTPGGLLMAEQMTEAGRAMERARPTNGSNGARGYTQARYERHDPPGQRPLLRVFVPLRDEDQALAGYLEAARLMPDWQQERLAADALRTGLLVALAVLLGGGALFPLVVQLHTHALRRQRELLDSHLGLMAALDRAIAHCDADNDGHSYRVAWIAATLAEAVGLRGTPLQELVVGSFLHDVGKIGVPDHILLKSAPLSEEETRILRTHVGLGEDIVGEAGWLGGARAVVAGHHERWDGTGYPRGQAGTDIPLAARIFTLAEAFDALCAPRPHHESMPLAQALQVLQAGAGRQFDPQLVHTFAELAPEVYHTLTQADPQQLHALLQDMVRTHFSLPASA